MAEQVVSRLDLIQFEAMRHQRLQIDAPAGDHRHQPPHPLLATGAERGDDLQIGEPRSEGIEWDRQVGGVNAQAVDS
jgi:hypothetical protein